jgi:PAS domain S-box-containing protein
MSDVSLKSFKLATKLLTIILLAFLIAIDASVLYHLNRKLRDDFRNHRNQELELISVFAEEVLNRPDRAAFERFLLNSCGELHDIASIKVYGTESIVAEFSKPGLTGAISIITRKITLQGGETFTLEFMYDMTPINRYLLETAIKLVIISTLVTVFIGIALWQTQIKLVLRPLVEEVQRRERAEEETDREKEYLTTVISQSKQVEAELSKFSLAVKQSPVSIIITDTHGCIEYVNPKFAEVTGYTYEEVIGHNPRILKSGEMDAELYREFWQTITSGNEWHGEFHNRKKNGDLYWELATVAPLKNGSGKVTHYIAIKENITRIKQLIQDKQTSEERYRALFEQAADSILLIDGNTGEIVEFNETTHRTLGYTREEFSLLGIADIDASETAEEARKHMEKIVEQGFDNFDNRLRKKNGDLTHVSVNVRVITIAGKRYLQAIWRDITQQKLLEKELVVAMQKAEAANRAKSTFLTSMSHELRTPLNSIMGFAQVLQTNRQKTLSPKDLTYADYILNSGYYLLELINDVLDLSKIESGKYDLSLEPVQIKDLFIEAVDQISSLAFKHEVKVITEEKDLDTYLRADKRGIKQVLLNLLSNAVKYNQRQGTVHLACKRTGNRKILIEIADTGQGIPPEKLDRLFEPFDRLGAETSNIEGTGIGLTITRHLVDLMSGVISVESKVGKGTTFRLEFPETEAPETAKIPGQARQNNFSYQSLQQSESKTANKILYIEDNKANLKLMESVLLYRSELELIHAETAEKGIEMAVSEQPAIVLMDINLPGMDGFQALKQLKNRKETNHIPVIAVTAKAMFDDVAKARIMEFVNYITKPIDIARFKTIIDNLLDD